MKLYDLKPGDKFRCINLPEWGDLELKDNTTGLFYRVRALDDGIHTKLTREYEQGIETLPLINWVNVVRVEYAKKD